jgi:hypothetical protein
MSRIILAFLTVTLLQIPAAQSAEQKEVKVIEWNYEFYSLNIDPPTSAGTTSWLHSEVRQRIPFYDDIYAVWPMSMRFPNEVYMEKSNKEDVCYQIPVQVRAEIDLSYLRSTYNPIELTFWPRMQFKDNIVLFREASLLIGPNDWRESATVLNKKVNVCLSKELLGTDLLGIQLRTNISYSRLFTEFKPQNLNDCVSHTLERCTYAGFSAGGIAINQQNSEEKDEVTGYIKTITELRNFISTQRNVHESVLEMGRRNLLFLEADLEAAKIRSKERAEAKAAAELKAKQEAEAKASAELKAKQQADAKAAAELKAKQEADAKAAADKAAADKAAADKAAALKKITITCIKGKLTKKVTAVKPICPAGYKKK